MRNFILLIFSLFLLGLLSTCEPWDLKMREDHQTGPENGSDTCCYGDCLVDTCRFITFANYYGTAQDEYAKAVIATSDGGYLVIGETTDPIHNDYEIFLVQIDSMGTKVWQGPFGSRDDEFAMDGIELDNENVVILGNVNTSGNGWQNYFMLLDPGLNKLDDVQTGLFDVDFAYSLTTRADDNGYLSFGYTGTWKGADGFQAMLFDVDESTFEEETRAPYGEQYDDFGLCIERTSGDEYLALVSEGTADGTDDLYLYRLDGNYNTVDRDQIITNSRKVVGSVSEIPAGGYVIAGAISGDRLRMVKTDANGNPQETKDYSDSYADSAVSVIPTDDGGFIALTSGMVMIKTLSNLTEEWRKEWSGEIYGNNAILQTADGGFILVGSKENPASAGPDADVDIYVVKTDRFGNIWGSK